MNCTQCQSALFVFCLTRGSAGDSNALRQISLTAVVRKWALKLVEKLIASQRTGYVPNLKVADTSSSPYGKFERLTFECQDVCSEASAPVALWALLLFLLIMFIPARVLSPPRGGLPPPPREEHEAFVSLYTSAEEAAGNTLSQGPAQILPS